MTLSHDELMRAIQAKSDQLNSVDLLGGPLVSNIVDIKRGNAEQPVVIVIDSHPQPWKPSKTALRVICACWGGDPQTWIGRTVVLYNDEKVKWAGQEVGGIRISHMSHIDGPKTIMVNETRGKKAAQKVLPYRAAESAAAPVPAEKEYYPADKFDENFQSWADLIGSGEKTPEQIVAAIEKRAKLTSGQRSRIMACTVYAVEDVPAATENAPAPDDGDPFGE